MLLASVMLTNLAGCAPKTEAPREDAPLETVDIADDPDFAPDEDPREAPRRMQLAGVLPSGFPSDLPVHLPASVEAFGAEGRTYRVEFLSQSAPQTVRSSLAAKLTAAGWRGNVTIGASTVTKAGRSIEVTVAAAEFGSRYAYVY